MGVAARTGDHTCATVETCGRVLPSRDRVARHHAGDRDCRDLPAALVSVLAAALEATGRGRIRAALDGELGSAPRSAPDVEQERQRPERRAGPVLTLRAPAAGAARREAGNRGRAARVD